MWVRSSIAFYGNFNLDMDRSPGFGSTPTDYFALFRLGFPISPLSTPHPHPFQRMWVRSSIAFYGNFNLDMDRSPGFGSTPTDYFALFRLGFPSDPGLQPLTSPASVTRRTVLQQVRGSAYIAVPQLVNIWFQVLFHSPPGVLFTFPSQYYALSVTKEYLALRGGPRLFPHGSTCLVVLWIPPCQLIFRLRGFHPLWLVFPKPFY